MSRIIQEGVETLRLKAKKVSVKDITSKEIQNVIKKMKTALHKEIDGVALAAPQIDISLRIFIVSGMIFDDNFIRGKTLPLDYVSEQKDLVFINPEFVKISKAKKWQKEGCLSVRPYYGEVQRFLNATVKAYDEHGNQFVRGAGGLLAHIYQHEMDHLEGILFIDKARNLHTVDLPIKIKKHT
jgi:peptide deformylase